MCVTLQQAVGRCRCGLLLLLLLLCHPCLLAPPPPSGVLSAMPPSAGPHQSVRTLREESSSIDNQLHMNINSKNPPLDAGSSSDNMEEEEKDPTTSQFIEISHRHQVSFREEEEEDDIPVQDNPHLISVASRGGSGVPAPAGTLTVGTVQVDESLTSAGYPPVNPGNGSPITGSKEPSSSRNFHNDVSLTQDPSNIHTSKNLHIVGNSEYPSEQDLHGFSQTRDDTTTTRHNDSLPVVRRQETVPDITGTIGSQQLLFRGPQPTTNTLSRSLINRSSTTTDRQSPKVDEGSVVTDEVSLTRDGGNYSRTTDLLSAHRRSLTTDRKSMKAYESLLQSQTRPLSPATVMSATDRTNGGSGGLNKADAQLSKITKQLNNTKTRLSNIGEQLRKGGTGAGGQAELLLPSGSVTVGGRGHTTPSSDPASRPGPRYADPLTTLTFLTHTPHLPQLPTPHQSSSLTPQALATLPWSPLPSLPLSTPQTHPMRQDSPLRPAQYGRETQEPIHPSTTAGRPHDSLGVQQQITGSLPGNTHPSISSSLYSQTNSNRHQTDSPRQPYGPPPSSGRPLPVGGDSQVLSTSQYLLPRVNTGQRADLRQRTYERPEVRSPLRVYFNPATLKARDEQPPSDAVRSYHRGDGEGSSQDRIAYIRQSASLNPLRIRPSSQVKPGALSSTPLAYPDHRNFSYINLTQHSQPDPLSHAGGGPVDPAQLILRNSNARPAVPGRPPSNIIAQPSPVNPVTLLGSPEPPTASLTVRTKTNDSASQSSSPQASSVPGVEDLGSSPFFSGSPERPSYVFTTSRPPSVPVQPANLLIATGGATTRPPITVPPPGYNPLLDNLQRLDVIEANSNRHSTTGVHIPAPQFPYPLPQDYNSFPSASNPAYLGQTRPGSSHLNFPATSSPTLSVQNLSRPFPNFKIPGAVLTGPPPPPLQPVVISNNTVVKTQNIDPIIGLIDAKIALDTLAQIANLTQISQTTQPERDSQPSLSAALGSVEPANQNTGQGTRPTGMLTSNAGTDASAQQVLHPSISAGPPQTVGNIFPPPPQNSQHPGYQRYPFITPSVSNPQNNLDYPQNLNDLIGYPGYSQGPYPLRPIPQLSYPPSSYPQGHFPPYPGYVNRYGNQFGPSPQYPPGLSFQSQVLGSNERQGVGGMGSSASVSATIKDQSSSATSEAEGGDGVVSSSTTVINGGTSTSNNNFYRPVSGPVLGSSVTSPATASFQPPRLRPFLPGVQMPRPRPPIIVDGVLNTTAILSDVFPGSNLNVACSRRHGCPTFILRTRPSDPPPEDNRRNTYIYDEALGTIPTGNINIACDFQEGCPTYIINTTPTPTQQQESVSTPTPPDLQHQPGTSPSPPAPAVDNQALLNAITLVLGLLNQTEDFSNLNEDESLTGNFDSIFHASGVDGYDDTFMSHTAGSIPIINPQNIRPGLQTIPSNIPPSPLAQHIGLQNRPNYKVVRVPGNTVLSPASFSDLLDNKQNFKVNPILTSGPGVTRGPTQTFLGQPGTQELLRNQLLQAHLDSLQEHGGLGLRTSSPLRGHNLEEGSLDDAHMGQVVAAAATQPPPVAAILNLERQDIPNEPPLVPSDGQGDDHHHSTMMRKVMAAAFVGLPMTTALLGALGAPVAIMAPLGLAIPALLTMGFMDVNSNSGGFGSHFRRHPHRHNTHQPAQASTNSDDELRSDHDDGTTTDDPHGDTRNSRRRGQGGGESHRPSSPDGGGMAGAIRRTLGLLPMLASRLTSIVGLARRRRRRRRTADQGGTADYEDISELTMSSLAGAVAAAHQPSSLLSEEEEEDIVPPAAPPFLQQDLDTLENMTHYYYNLRRNTNNKNNDSSLEVVMPTPEEIELQCKYLLKLLKQLTKNFQRLSSVGDFASVPQGSVLTKSQQELLFPPSSVDPTFQPVPSGPSQYTPETLHPSHNPDTLVDHSSSTVLHYPEGHSSAGPANSGVAVNRIGQVHGPSGYADFHTSQYADSQTSQYTDLQNLDLDTAALLIHQLQTQGSPNLLPPGLLGQTPLAKPSTQQYDIVFGSQTAAAAPSSPLASPLNTATFPVHPHRTQAIAEAAGFQGSLPPSLMSVVLQGGDISTHQPGGGGGGGSSSVLFGEASQFSDYTALADTFLLSLEDDLLLQPPPTSVLMVDSLDFQELDSVPFPPQSPSLLQQDDDPELDRLDLQSATVALQNTAELTTALTNFITNLADAISQLLTDLQAAITANPPLALLFLLPLLLLLPFLFHKGGGYGGGGGYHRRVYNQQGRALIADTLAQWVLADIERLERVFRSQEGHPP